MPAVLPDGTWVSDDGHWRLAAGRWQAVPPRLTRPPGPFWFLGTDGAWVRPMLLTGLISLIPIVGFMTVYGWALLTAGNLRLGYRVPAPAGFGGLNRGWRYGAWALGLAFLVGLVAVGLGALGAAAAYAVQPGWVWPLAIGAGLYLTVLGISSLLMAPTTLPVLLLTDAEGLAAALHPRRVIAEVRRRWDVAWFAVAVLLLWSLAYYVLVFVGNLLPFVGPLASIALVIPGYGLLGLMLAAPLARADDPPSSFPRNLANTMAAVYAVLVIVGIAAAWALCITGGWVVSTHPEETACFFAADCDFRYSGSRETITHANQSGAVVTVRVEYINRSPNPDVVATDEYWIAADRYSTSTRVPPSADCPPPRPVIVPPGGRVTQTACFRAQGDGDEVHIPWTGWDSRTVTPRAG